MQAITLTVARAATIESWSNVVELAGSISRRRAARRRGLLVLSSVMGWECSVSDKRNPAIVEVNLNGAPQFTISDFYRNRIFRFYFQFCDFCLEMSQHKVNFSSESRPIRGLLGVYPGAPFDGWASFRMRQLAEIARRQQAVDGVLKCSASIGPAAAHGSDLGGLHLTAVQGK